MMMKRVASLLLCAMLVIAACAPVYAQGAVDMPNGIVNDGQIVDDGGTNDDHQNSAIVTKTIEKTDTENVFEITLKVETPINVEKVKIDQSAAVVIVIDNSGSMGSNPENTSSRIYKAKEAAKTFVDDFAKTNNSNVSRLVSVVIFNDEASILTNTSGKYWFDVANGSTSDSADEAAVKALINGIGAAPSGKTGTNTEAGLQIAKNLYNSTSGFWKYNRVKGMTSQKWNEIKDKIGKNVILLTDGVPITFINEESAVDGKTSFTGESNGNGDWVRDTCYTSNRYYESAYEKQSNGTYQRTTDDGKVSSRHAPYRATQKMIQRATELKNSGVSVFGIAVDLMNIYVEKAYPHENGTWQQKYHAYLNQKDNTAYKYVNTVNWMKEWCNGAYSASNNLSELQGAFSSVLENTVNTWKVSDELPHYMSVVGNNDNQDKAATWSGNTLSWNLQEDTTESKKNGKYVYTYTYTVALDPTEINEDDLNDDKLSVNTNKVAALPTNTQEGINAGDDDTRIEFPHPTIKSDPATITIVKIDDVTGLPLPEAKFKLEGKTTGYTGSDNNYSVEQLSAIVTENGVSNAEATFSISGGAYTLTESVAPLGYDSIAQSWTVGASFGTITDITPNDFTLSENLKHAEKIVTNTRQTGSLTISNKEDETVSVVTSKIDRDKTFAFDVVFHTQKYYGSSEYVALANKTYQAVLTDENGASSNIEISTDENGKAWIKAGDAELTPFTLGLDDSIVINGLPVGTQFTIKETPFEYFDLTGITAYDKEASIESEKEYDYLGTVMLDNSESTEDESAPDVEFINTRKTGSVKVSKATVDKMLTSTEQFPFKLVVDGGEAYPNVRMLTGVYGTYHEDGAESGAQTISIQHQTEAGKNISVSEFDLSDLDYAIIGKLPVGFAYTVTEEMTQAQAKAYTGSVAVTNETEDGKIAADTTPEHAFTNTYRSGSLIIEKRVEGNGAHNSKDFTFKVVLGDESIHSAYDTDNDPDTVNNGGRITVKRLSPAKPDGEEETVEFDQGTAYVTLKPGERLVFSGVPTETENKLSAQVSELSDAEVRVLKGKLVPDNDTGADEDNTQDSEDEDDAQQEEEALQADLDYGKDGYADYEVMVNGVKSAVVEGEIVENGENVEPMTAL